MDNFRISRLEINQIGPFGHLAIDFWEKPAGMTDRAEIHILTGENGTGKTTVLEMLSAGIFKDTNNLYKKCRSTDGIISHLQISLGTGDVVSWSALGNRYSPDSPVARFVQSMNTYLESSCNLMFFAYSGYRRIEQAEIDSNPEVKGNPFEDALSFKQSINPQKILNWVASTKIDEALAQGTPRAGKYKEAIVRIEKVIESIIEKPVKFKLESEPRRVLLEVSGETLDFNLLPDGLKSIVSWIADLLMRMDRVKWENDTPVFERNFILFLDEIEVHLHPAWQRKILPSVQSLFPNAQIFISTHSPFVVGSVDGAWIHKFVKPNGDSQLAGPPVLSEDAKSFRYWLSEIFDIETEFGVGAKRQLDEFYRLRDSLLVNGTPQEREEFAKLAVDLSIQSREMESIVSWELRQFNKRVQKPVEI